MTQLTKFRAYPYKERLSYAALMLCVTVWMFWGHWPRTLVDLTLIAAVILTFFCGPKGRPFWFLWGVVVGVILTALTITHSGRLW